MRKLVSAGLLVGLLAGAIPVGTSFAVLPKRPNLTIGYGKSSCGDSSKIKIYSYEDVEILNDNEEIIEKYKNLLDKYKIFFSLMNDRKLEASIKAVFCYWESFGEMENKGKRVDEKSLARLEMALKEFVDKLIKPQNTAMLLRGKSEVENAVKEVLETYSDWKLIDEKAYSLLWSDLDESEEDGDERMIKLNANYIPSDSSDIE